MKNKLIELINNAWEKAEKECGKHFICSDCKGYEYCPENCMAALTADHLIENGVTLQTAPISYERLLHVARQMHLWIFLNCADEQKAYDELKITAEENVVFGYGGKLEITMPELPKGNNE